MYSKIILIKGLVFFGYFASLAQAAETDNLQSLFELDFSELSNVQFTIASTRPESLNSTPAIVSRYKVSDMEHLGLRTLKDILAFIPGFTMQDTGLGGASIMIRGVAEVFNQKVLFLLDDAPYWMSSHASIALLGIPISSIESVEAIRGLGAVIYGTNASTGVIKIVTKQAQNNQISLSLSANNRSNLSAYYSYDLGTRDKIDIAMETQNDDGYPGEHIDASIPPPFSMPSPPPTRGYIDKPEDFNFFSVNYRNKDFHIGMQKFSSSVNELAGFGSLENQSSLDYDGTLFKIDNSWHLQKTDLKLFADYNQFYLTIPLRNHPLEGTDGRFEFDDHGKDNYRRRVGGVRNIA